MKKQAGAIKRILYVDDDDASRCLMELIINELGYELVLVSGGEEAIEKVRTERFDLILMDVRMPCLNGYETTRTIRQLDPEIPIVACTAHVMPGVPKKCEEAGMVGFIRKPIDIDSFETIVKEYLG